MNPPEQVWLVGTISLPLQIDASNFGVNGIDTQNILSRKIDTAIYKGNVNLRT